jgi:hypothetical protein
MAIIWHRDGSISVTHARAARKKATNQCRNLPNVDVPDDAYVSTDVDNSGLWVEARVWIECDKSGKPL